LQPEDPKESIDPDYLDKVAEAIKTLYVGRRLWIGELEQAGTNTGSHSAHRCID
jgi:hypothetical protein